MKTIQQHQCRKAAIVSTQQFNASEENLQLLRPPRIEKIYESRAAAEALNTQITHILEQFPDQSDRSRSITRQNIHDQGLLKAVVGRIHCDHFGVLPEHAQLLFRYCKLPETPFFANGHYSDLGVERYAFSDPLPKDIVFTDGQSTIKTFPCQFRNLPIGATRPIDGITAKGARVFALYLEPDAMREVINSAGDKYDPRQMHVYSAFAYLRYYKEDGLHGQPQIFVSEIQSDFHNKLSSSLRSKYWHWEEMLLSAFQATFSPAKNERKLVWQGMFENLGEMGGLSREQIEGFLDPKHSAIAAGVQGHIYLPLPKIIRDRWQVSPDQPNSTLSQTKAETIYGIIPEKLGYKIVNSPKPYFHEVDPNGNQINQLFSWVRPIQPIDSIATNSLLAQIAPTLHHYESAFIDPLHRYEELFPPSIFAKLSRDGLVTSFPISHKSDINFSSLPGLITIPIEPIPPSAVPGLTEAMQISVNNQFANPALNEIAKHFRPEFSFFSKGVHHGLPSDWWNIPHNLSQRLTLEPMAIENQKRHPSLRVTINQIAKEDTTLKPLRLAVGAKGGGLTHISKEDIWFPRHSDSPPTAFPIHKPKENPLNHIPSHSHWGGLRLDHALAEYRNSVGLAYLLESTGKDPLQHMAVPLNVAKLHSVPLYKKSGTEWKSASDYLFHVLEDQGENSDSHLAIYLSASKSDVRLSQVVNRIISRSKESQFNLNVCKEEIDSALSYLFKVNERSFTIPAGINIEPSEDGIGPVQYQQYVNRILQANSKNGKAIFDRITRNLIETVALVHGAGGHLGGACVGFDWEEVVGRSTPIGAVGGGAAALRNVDCCGGVHDLDSDIYLPWVSPLSKQDGTMTQIFRNLDMLFLGETIYWFRAALVGEPVHENSALINTAIEHKFNRLSIYSDLQVATDYLIPYLASDTETSRLFETNRQENSLFDQFSDTAEDIGTSQKTNNSASIQYVLNGKQLIAPLRLTDEQQRIYDNSFKRGQTFAKTIA